MSDNAQETTKPFLNPYNFVPFPRFPSYLDSESREVSSIGPAGSFDRSRSDLLFGEIEVTFTTRTPLLILDTSRDEIANGHVTSTTRTLDSKHPLIQATSVKGALRAAYEAVSGSRLGVPVSKEKLTYRTPGRNGVRREYDEAPAEVIPDHLRPLESHHEASAADRLFGYSADHTESMSHRGHLRIWSVDCAESTIQAYEEGGMTLQPLASPKPSQYRFYFGTWGASVSEPPQRDLSAERAYTKEGVVRGRKFYMNRKFAQVGAGVLKTDQNRTVTDVIRTGSKFTVKMRVDGANPEDLGVLLWILGREPDGGAHLMLGLGKPFGFGSIVVADPSEDLVIRLWTGEEDRNAISNLRSPVVQFDGCFTQTVLAGEPACLFSTFFGVDGATNIESSFMVPGSVLSAFEEAMRSHDGIVSYPFVGKPEELGSRGREGYRWFVANSRRSIPQVLPTPGETLTSYDN